MATRTTRILRIYADFHGLAATFYFFNYKGTKTQSVDYTISITQVVKLLASCFLLRFIYLYDGYL